MDVTRIWLVWLVTAVLAGGCNDLFGVDHEPRGTAWPDAPPADGAEPYSACGAFLDDEPLRYATVANPNVTVDDDGNATPAAWSWADARAACRLRGMDLAVFNDAHELGRVEVPAWPYWVGEALDAGAWSTVDGCPALAPAASGMTDGCAYVRGPLDITAARCDGVLPAGGEASVVLAALCETPRPTSETCLGNDPMTTRYVVSPEAMSYADAKELCGREGGKPVVVETHAELLRIAQMADRRVWIGSTFRDGTWATETGCPGTYAWSAGVPTDPTEGSCLSTTVIGDEQGITRTTGMDTTACGADEVFALCEVTSPAAPGGS